MDSVTLYVQVYFVVPRKLKSQNCNFSLANNKDVVTLTLGANGETNLQPLGVECQSSIRQLSAFLSAE